MTMRNDASRPHAPVRESRPLRSVVARQGQVLLDTDVNDGAALLLGRLESADAHMLGSPGRLLVPGGSNGFAVAGGGAGITIAAGTAYLDGWQVVNAAPATLANQPNPWAGAIAPGAFAVALRALVRHVDPAEEPGLTDVALGDAQASGRAIVDWQVVPVPLPGVPAPTCETVMAHPAWIAMSVASSGRLAFSLPVAPPAADPCSLTPTGGHSRFENLLYRIEVDGGIALADSPGPHDPRFGIDGLRLKFSRRNGSLMVRVSGVNGTRVSVQPPALDPLNWFAPGAWAELVRQGDDIDASGAMASTRLFRIGEADDDSVQLVEAAAGAIAATGVNGNGRWYLRLWDAWPDGEGVRVVPAAGGSFDLGDGIAIQIAAQAGARLRRGDWWSAAVRADGSIAWPDIETPNPQALPPMGPPWRYAPLAIASAAGAAGTVDCRVAFASLSDRALLYRGGDGQSLFAAHAGPGSFRPLPHALRVAVMRGANPVAGARVRWQVPVGHPSVQVDGVMVQAGQGREAITGMDGLCSVNWAIDAGRQGDSHRIEAVLLEAGQPAATPAVQFSARFDSAGQTSFQPPGNCPTLAPANTVQDALERLCAALDDRKPPSICIRQIRLTGGPKPIDLVDEKLILNGLIINAVDILENIVFATDAKSLDCQPRADDPLVEVALDLPYPTTDPDKRHWLEAAGTSAVQSGFTQPFATRTTRLAGQVKISGGDIVWSPNRLTRLFLQSALRHGFGSRVTGQLSDELKRLGWAFPDAGPVLCRIRVRGALVFGTDEKTGRPIWFNGQHLGTSAGITRRELLLDEREPVRAGDLELFLIMSPGPKSEKKAELGFELGSLVGRLANNANVAAMLKELADQQRTTGKTVVVRGHDDGAGTPQQQLALSQRRAAAIEAELVRLGVPAQMVRVEAMGNQENVGATTPTGNRRVEILFE